MSGAELLGALNENGYRIPVVMLTAYGTIEKAVDAMRKSAFNYITKPVNPDELLIVTKGGCGKAPVDA